MAYTTPRTWTAAETVTAALMNTHIRDNLAFLYTQEFGSYTASSTANVTTGTFTLVAWDGEVEESSGLTHDNSTNNSRILVTLAGLYEVNISLGWTANATGMRGVVLRKNSAGSNSGGTQLKMNYNPATTAQFSTSTLTWTVRLSASDYIEVFRYQSSGGNLAPTAIDSRPGVMTVRRVSG